MTARLLQSAARFATLTTILAAGYVLALVIIPWALFTLLGLN